MYNSLDTKQKAHSDYFDQPPPHTAQQPAPDHRLANSADYIAHQLFHIRKALERIANRLDEQK